MKKIFISLVALLATVAVQAQMFYLLPYSANVNGKDVVSKYDYLPWEGDGTEANVEVSPERRANEWFTNTMTGSQERFLTIKDVKEGALLTGGKLDSVRVLWINVDKVGYTLEDFDAAFDATFKAQLASFVKAGGNLYLSKQATRLVSEIGRCTWWPTLFANGGYVTATDEWQMCYNFCTEGNVDHVSLKYTENHQKQDELNYFTRLPLTSKYDTVAEYRRTDNNSLWSDWAAYTLDAFGGCDIQRRNGFEQAQKCKILGGWGHTRGLDAAGYIEFYPDTIKGEFWAGTVMVMGLSAYQWGPQNASEYNVKNLTRGILEYLKGEAHWLEGFEPKDGYVGDTMHVVPLSNFEGYHIDLISSNSNIAEYIGDGNYVLKAAGDVKIQAIYVGDGVQSCKTKLVLESKIAVNDTTTGWQTIYKSVDVPVKMIYNHQLIIIRNGKRYSANGLPIE